MSTMVIELMNIIMMWWLLLLFLLHKTEKREKKDLKKMLIYKAKSYQEISFNANKINICRSFIASLDGVEW